MFKLSMLTVRRKEFIYVIHYAQQNFWHLNYNHDEKVYFADCVKLCKLWVVAMYLMTQGVLAGYVITPLSVNIGKNKSDRVLPFNMWLDLPLSVTPYYELMFVFEIMCVYQIGAAYVCTECFVCLLNMHTICQFRMLQLRLMNLCSVVDKELDSIDHANAYYTALKKCIRDHQSLLEFCDKLNVVYTLPILGHMIVFSILMCFDTYEIFLVVEYTLQLIVNRILVFANMGKNKSDRVLPFNMWLDVPLSMTPYYEMTFTLQILCVYQIGAAYVCTDSMLCMLNMYVILHFRILQQKLLNLVPADNHTEKIDYVNEHYTAVKKCIRYHQSLIGFCDMLENVYSLPILGHMVVFSLLMCFDTYEILLADIPTVMRFIFIFHMIGSFIHIIFFTYSCHGLLEESMNVCTATYSSWWSTLPMNRVGKMLRRDTRIVMIRSQRPCCLTAGGFFPVSLETATALMSSTISYFTLMRESSGQVGGGT
ncbi:unnamed protein product [Xylocopa violacea]|uniref:Odorant receptor n=1 Tax=Xylocopa violacea TaxID=135666 RepID=A0ABP1N998_XYLVO